MTKDSVRIGGNLLKIASKARRRRLEIQRVNSVGSMNSMEEEVDPHFASDVFLDKKRQVIKELTSSATTSPTRKKSKIDDGKLTPEPSVSRSAFLSGPSSEKAGAQVRILVAAGETSEEDESRSDTCLSHGSISVIGRRRVMEDAVTVAPGFLAGKTPYDFFAVYDGHGGTIVARACSDRLHQLLAKEVEGCAEGCGGGCEIDWEKVMMACFSKMDDEVNSKNCDAIDQVDGSASVATMGSTAVVVIVGKKELVVANCGDSRAVLCRNGVALPLSCDHKPDRPDEKERVEAAGGKVINWNGCRVLGVLATSRSIGDHHLRPYVNSEPEVTVRERTEFDDFIIIASDGLWDVVSNEFSCEVVRRCLAGQIQRNFSEEIRGSCATEAAAMLVELAMARGSKDNISVMVVELRKLPEIISS